VQGALEEALRTALRQPSVAVTCAGRTDAGVHARGQVVHVDLAGDVWAEYAGVLLARLRGLLPDDVVLRALAPAPAGFDARFSATWRRYAYRVCDAPAGPDPLRRHEVVHHRRPLNVESMQSASAALLGEHDFAAYCRRREGATTVRALRELSWTRDDDLVVATVVADAFCHNMVRSLVGAVLAVGDGRRPVEWPAEVLAGRVRVPEVQVAPAHGLCLEEVGYPPDAELAEQAGLARRRRGPVGAS
jgi:tRNA pseudouridine38-40 synthase